MINIVLPYEKAEFYTEIWAHSESEICFEKDTYSAERCTISYAAHELKTFLGKILTDEQICYSNIEKEGFNIILESKDEKSNKEDYSIIPEHNGVRICGAGRAGVLYGAYEFLKLQGFRWYAPGEIGEVVPPPSEKLKNVTQKMDFSPHMYEGRGFDLEGFAIESEHLWIWMARNRLNYGVYSYRDNALQKKLCIKFKMGGHIFEGILSPDRVLENGKTMWEEHSEWYGKRSDGKEVTKKNCLETQFCVTNAELVEFLSAEVVKLVNGKWSGADRIDIWGFDTWGSVCDCDECRKLGNSTDRTLHFISELRTAIDNAGIGNRIRLVTCSYEGTSTIEPPTRRIPDNLIAASDLMVYYPITRCYKHDMDDETCAVNKRFDDFLKGWTQMEPAMPVVIGEYYNVSKFEDLPILFTKTMKKDIPHYYNIGVRGITYMHFPLLNLALRAVTHLLYAELSWDTETDADHLIDDYFTKYYEGYADRMKRVYALLEKAFENCTQWRAWKSQSLLSQLIIWNGEVPQNPLRTDGHFTDHASIIKSGEESIVAISEALEIVKSIQGDLIMSQKVSEKKLKGAVNPFELGKLNKSLRLMERISEDKRFILYGLDTMKLMTEVVKLYNALYLNQADVSKEISTLEFLYDKMDSYFVPLGSNTFQRGLNCKSALVRTQLENTVTRCIRLYKK